MKTFPALLGMETNVLGTVSGFPEMTANVGSINPRVYSIELSRLRAKEVAGENVRLLASVSRIWTRPLTPLERRT